MSDKQQQIDVLKALIVEHEACKARLIAMGMSEYHPNILHLDHMIEGCKANLGFAEMPTKAKIVYGYAPKFAVGDIVRVSWSDFEAEVIGFDYTLYKSSVLVRLLNTSQTFLTPISEVTAISDKPKKSRRKKSSGK